MFAMELIHRNPPQAIVYFVGSMQTFQTERAKRLARAGPSSALSSTLNLGSAQATLSHSAAQALHDSPQRRHSS